MYSGGEGEGFHWTQTDEEIELKIPVPPEVRGRDVKVGFKPLAVSVSINGEDMKALNGTLEAPVHPEECVWDMESGHVVLTLLKAAEGTWKRLLTHQDQRRVRRIDGGEDEGDKEGALEEGRGLVQELFMQAQGDDVYKFEEAMQANRDDATPDDDEADRNVLSKCQDANNRNSLHFAAHAGSAGVVEYVLKKNPGMIDNRDLDGATALVLALMKEHSEVANLLLDLGADGTVASHDGTSALHHASGIGDAATVRRLLEAGANLEGGSPSGTPLHWAAGEGALGALKVLLEAGANPNAPDPRGVPALAMAVVRGAEECCTLLLGASADCTASLPGGMLPLHVAADMGNSVLVERLLAACPEAANVLDEQGNSALSLATTAGHEAIVALLEPATTVQGVTPVDDSFLEVDSFDGSRPGYVFKMGERGLGYYKETPKAAPERIKPEVQIAPEAATAAMQLKAKGNEHLKAKQLEEAEEAYSGAIALDHTQHTFFTNRSLCRLKRGDKEGALADAEAAKELAPEDVKVRWRLGAALEALDRYVDASGEYYEGLKLDMDNTEMKKAFEKAVARGKQSHAFKTYNQ